MSEDTRPSLDVAAVYASVVSAAAAQSSPLSVPPGCDTPVERMAAGKTAAPAAPNQPPPAERSDPPAIVLL